MEKKRLDILLVEMGFCSTRTRAQEMIRDGFVTVDGEKNIKPGEKISPSSSIALLKKEHPYVSRGGIKLNAALEHFKIEPRGKIALDVGSSTGGFTHCLLLHGAERVYAVDVGTGQLVESLRSHPQVKYWEQMSIQTFPTEFVGAGVDIIVVDVSFVSLKKIIPFLRRYLKTQGSVILLIKPQFEVGPENINKQGIVRAKNLYEVVLQEIEYTARVAGFVTQGTMLSPILGGDGNTEFFLHMIRAD